MIDLSCQIWQTAVATNLRWQVLLPTVCYTEKLKQTKNETDWYVLRSKCQNVKMSVTSKDFWTSLLDAAFKRLCYYLRYLLELLTRCLQSLMITDWIRLHSVLSPVLIECNITNLCLTKFPDNPLANSFRSSSDYSDPVIIPQLTAGWCHPLLQVVVL